MSNNFRKHITKKDQLIRLLGTKSGCNIKSLSARLGWQQHTTRAALSGLRKAGYEIASEPSAPGTVSKYRITASPVKPENTPGVAEFNGA